MLSRLVGDGIEKLPYKHTILVKPGGKVRKEENPSAGPFAAPKDTATWIQVWPR